MGTRRGGCVLYVFPPSPSPTDVKVSPLGLGLGFPGSLKFSLLFFKIVILVFMTVPMLNSDDLDWSTTVALTYINKNICFIINIHDTVYAVGSFRVKQATATFKHTILFNNETKTKPKISITILFLFAAFDLGNSIWWNVRAPLILRDLQGTELVLFFLSGRGMGRMLTAMHRPK